MLARTLNELFGDSFKEGLLIPGSVRELQLAVRTLRRAQARVNEEVRISRERLLRIGTIDSKSALIEVEAGVRLETVEAAANGYDLGLGFLPPGAHAHTVAEFLEGPYAGLRPIPGGRLEPLAVALHVVLPEGEIVAPHVIAPRSAAGPELAALHLGGEGRAGFIVAATLRLMPRPRTRQTLAFSFEDVGSLLSALRRALADGSAIESAAVQRRGKRFIAQITLAGATEGVERDARTLSLRVASWSGRAVAHTIAPPEGEARELSWDDVGKALGEGATLGLHRLALEALIVHGAGELGRSMARAGDEPMPPEMEALYALLDPARSGGENG